MQFAHDTEIALRAAVALVNSAAEPDTLTGIGQLDVWCDEHAYTGRRDRDPGELEAMRGLRPLLRELLTAGRDLAAQRINTVLAEANAVPQLRRHDGLDWHFHAVPDDAPLDRRVVVEAAMGMSDLVRTDELRRISICADEHCDKLVLDLSRNRSRRYCSTACTNRNAAAAYRARAREKTPADRAERLHKVSSAN